jgi:hypothetical protein
MKLDKHELDSPLCTKIREYLTETLEKKRRALEMTSKTPDETNILRGQIQALRSLIAKLTEQAPAGDKSTE